MTDSLMQAGYWTPERLQQQQSTMQPGSPTARYFRQQNQMMQQMRPQGMQPQGGMQPAQIDFQQFANLPDTYRQAQLASMPNGGQYDPNWTATTTPAGSFRDRAQQLLSMFRGR